MVEGRGWMIFFIWSRVVLLWDLKRKAFFSFWFVFGIIVIRPEQDEVV